MTKTVQLSVAQLQMDFTNFSKHIITLPNLKSNGLYQFIQGRIYVSIYVPGLL